MSANRANGPALAADAEVAAALAEASAVAVLVGGYDGSGNFGDIAQLDATMELLEPLGGDLLVLPILERSRLRDHAELVAAMRRPPTHPLFLGHGEEEEDGLVAVAPPRQLKFAACFLYGGGYLNGFWGERKLQMLAAAEALLANAGSVRRIASGLQVDGAWLAGLGDGGRQALGAFELFGARDSRSRLALSEFASQEDAFESGDDAIGVLRDLATAAGPAGGGALRVNVHLGEHPFVGAEPGAILTLYLDFLAELGRRAGEPLIVQPLIAYLDRHVDERAGVERLTGACREQGIEVEEPLVPRPADLGQSGAALAAARLTLTCSYHVGLASLMAGVPTLAVRENRYYDHKVEGLLESFGLPPEFAIDSGCDGAERAGVVAAIVLDEERERALRADLRAGGAELGRRRLVAEAKLRGRLGASGPRHEIADLVRAPGELSFEARIDGDSTRVWLRSETQVTPPADAALAATLMATTPSGGTLSVPGAVSPRLLRTQREYQAIQLAWSRDWQFAHQPLREVEVLAQARPPAPRPERRVAAFFSGGVDSWATVLDNPDITDLIFVRGLDLIPGEPRHEALVDEVEQRLRDTAKKLGLPLHVVDTNLRTMADPLIRWEAYNPSAMIAVALFFEPLFERVLIASDTDHETQVPLGTSHMVDQLWSTEQLEIVDDGGRLNREQRLRRIADHPLVQETLRVCWENPGGAYNCGRCRKCLLTMVPLEAIGRRERFTSFPAELDLGLIKDFNANSPIALALWEDVLDTARSAGREDLERAVEPLVTSGRQRLGLPDSYRGRAPRPIAGTLAGALSEVEQRRAASEAEAGALRAQLTEILGSRSWRLTSPVRHLGARLRVSRAGRGRR